MATEKTTKKTTKTTKKAAKRKTAKKTTAKTKAKTAKAKAAAEDTLENIADDAENRLSSIVEQIRDSLGEAREALAESGSVMDDRRRDIALQLIANMQENADETFASLQDVVTADSLGDTLRISRDALRSGIERNVRQVKDFAENATDSTRETVEPVGDYLSSLRDKVRNRADA